MSDDDLPDDRLSGDRLSDRAWLVVALPCEIDISNAHRVRADLLAAIDQGSPIVVADMSRTTFCDCAGVSALLAAGSHAARAAAELRVVAWARPVLRTFELTGLQLALAVHPTTPAALGEPGTATTRPDPGGGVVRLSHRRRTAPG